MRPTLLFSLCLAGLCGGVAPPLLAAHLPVAGFKASSSGYYEVQVRTPDAGRTVTCQLLSPAGKVLSANSWVSTPPMTTVPVRYSGNDVQKVRCSTD